MFLFRYVLGNIYWSIEMFDLCTRLHVDDERAYSYRYCSDIFRCVFSFLGALGSMKRGDRKVAVGGFIGFIPFGFSNGRKMFYFTLSLSVLSVIIWVLFSVLRTK